MKKIFVCAIFLSSALLTREINASWAKNLFYITAATGVAIVVWKVCKEINGGIKKFLGTEKIDERIEKLEAKLTETGDQSNLNFDETKELLKKGFSSTGKDCKKILGNQEEIMQHLGIPKKS